MSQKTESFIPFARPSLGQEEIDEVVAVLQSGWHTTGPRVAQFEEGLKTYFPSPYVLGVTHATGGLFQAYQALALKPGDEVITSPLTFVATVNPLVLLGVKPVFADINRDTYNIDPDAVRKVITPRTRAIVPVHFAGQSVDLDPLYALAAEHNLIIIEDAAQAIGTQYKGKNIGSFGDIQIFSFHPNKNISTGEGGAISCHREEFFEFLNLTRFHGIDRNIFNRNSKGGGWSYDVTYPALKFNMSDIQGALGIHQLKKLDGFIEKRTALAERYIEHLSNCPGLKLPSLATFDQRHSWHLFAPTLLSMPREQFIEEMRNRTIGVGVHYDPVHLFSYFRQTLGTKEGDFPHAEWVGERIVSLPLFPDLTLEQQDRVISAVRELLG